MVAAKESGQPVSRRQAGRGDGSRLREVLLEAGRSILADTGNASALTVRALCDRASVAPGSFYLHFVSRDEFVYELAYRSLGESETQLGHALAGVDDALTRVQMRGEAYLDYALRNPDLYRVLFMGTGHEATPTRFEGYSAFEDTGLGPLADDIAAAIADGTITAGDPHAIASVLWMTQHGCASLLISLPDFPWPTVSTLRTALEEFTASGLGEQDDTPTIGEPRPGGNASRTHHPVTAIP